MDQPRIALVGVENSHATKIIEHLNVDTGRRDGAVVALIGAADDERAQELARLGGIDTLVPTSAELLGEVDALVVTSRHGDAHRAHAEPFLQAGTPVWVDKPLACTTDDADAIITAAEGAGTPVTSFSPLRWVDDVEATAAAIASGQLGELQSLTLTGPADPDSPFGGIFFYGIHCADVAQRLCPGDPTDLAVDRHDATVSVRYRVGTVSVRLQLVRPDGSNQVPFHAEVVGRHGLLSHDITLGPHYVRPGVTVFLDMLRSGQPPVPYDEIRRPITVLDSVRQHLAV